MARLLLCIVFLGFGYGVFAAVPKDYSVDMKAVVSDTAPHVVLSWSLRLPSNIASQKIHRRLKGQLDWVKLTDLSSTDASYTDETAVVGLEYEYWLQRTISAVLSPNSTETAVGYLSAGVKVPEVHSRGTLLLVIDDTMTTPLAPEISQLKLDLIADGWMVQTITAPRSGTATSTKALIATAYNANPTDVKAVYLLGHVPVPYSGSIAPDGHGDHSGAWPADGYYGDMDGNWTDSSVNNSTASSTRNRNVLNDGKFDQSTLPSSVELQVGRVDFNAMTKAPSSAVGEVSRLRRYLQKAHAYRHKLGPYANIPRRSIIRDGFGHFSGENFAVMGWASAQANVGPDITEVPTGQWFSTTYAGGKDYLWGYGCGGGSYESASSFGTTTDLGRLPSRVVFTGLFGSYHGDWDSDNNLMRAVLLGNAAGDSLGLCCFWSGRPHWFLHHLGMGETLGYSTRVSMNGPQASGGSYAPGGFSARGVHMGLVGDPALRMHAVAPPRNLSATSSSNTVNLRWGASTEAAVQGYHVYRSTSTSGPFTRLTVSPVSTTFYNDTGSVGTNYTYLVRTLKLESVPGGSYYNLSVGSPISITVNGDASSKPRNPSELAIAAQGTGVLLSWQDNSVDEAGFRIERRVNAAGSFSSLNTTALGAGTISYTDPGPFTHGSTYFYRVIATNSVGESVPSNEASIEAVAGFVEFTATRAKVNKSAGSASIGITRGGGGVGAVSVNYATSNVTANAGMHYTVTSGQLSWADGEQGVKTITVPITNTATPQLPRQFKLTLSSPTNGLAINQQSAIAVQIEDPSATLPSPWTSTLIGSLNDSSPAVFAEGSLGDSTMGGSGAVSGATSEAGRFIYQSRTGDGVMTVLVPSPIVNQGSARIALMVRASTSAGDVMAATVTASSAANFGTRFVYRTTANGGASAAQSADNNLDAPRWLRLKRVGNLFTSECSSDGTDWTSLTSATLASMPATAVWGVFHYSGAPNHAGVADYHLATYQSVSLPASSPGSLAAMPNSSNIALSWTDVATTETGYEIQRQAANGTWIALPTQAQNTTSFSDTGVLPGLTYQYRLRALSTMGDSSWVTASATAGGTTSGYRLWLQTNGLPMDETGDGGAMTAPANDGVGNLMKYALGLPLSANGYSGRAVSSIMQESGEDYLTFTYICPSPTPTDVSYAVQASSDLLANGWTTNGITPVSDTVSGNQRTVVVRLSAPILSSNPKFMRLKVTRP